jgi:putative nucleotidyltransferase with HDIG domain
MLEVRSADVKPGMIIAEDIMDANGRLILPEGTELAPKHSLALKMWGVASVPIRSGEEGESPDEESVEPKVSIAAKLRTRGLLKYNAEFTDNPFIASLGTIIEERLTEKLGQEEELPDKKVSVSEEEEPQEPPARPTKSNRTPANIIKHADLKGSHPAVYMRLVEVVNHPYSSSEDIARIISEDPGLTARLLRIANSSFYAFPGRIDTVSRAVTIIGTTQLCDLALATSAAKLFNKIPSDMIDQRNFWEHSISTGVFARQLAASRRLPNVERIFTAGLLHDIGRAVLFICCPEWSYHLLDKTRKENLLMYELEREEMGFSHAQLGAALLEEWNIPESIREAAARHHRPVGTSKFPVETALVHLADMISAGLEWGSSGEVCVPKLAPEAWQAAEISEDLLPKLVEESSHQIADILAILMDDD